MRFLGTVSKLWVLLTFSVSTGYFWIHNRDNMPLNLPPWLDHISVPCWLAYSGAFLAGALVTTLAFSFDTLGRAMEIRRLKKALKAAQGSSRGWDGRSSDDGLVLSRPASALSATGGDGVSPLS
jgi:uncharacterized integral membrane protein